MDGFAQMDWKDSRPEWKLKHPTTYMLVSYINILYQHINPKHILDVGAGSGLLSAAAALRWPEAKVLASDISPQACADAAVNMEALGLRERVEILRTEGLNHTRIQALQPFDLILANLTAPVLMICLRDIAVALSSEGTALISGFRLWERAEILEACRFSGLVPVEESEAETWVCLRCIAPSCGEH